MEDFWYGIEMEWKKIASMEYGKIVFHSISYHALEAPSHWAIFHNFFEKRAILMPFESHSAWFQSHWTKQNFWDLKAN